MAELKPCPFCGGADVEVREDGCLISGHRYWYILHIVSNRNCPMVNAWGEWTSSAKYTTKGNAIEAWNRRAGETNG